MLKNSVSLCSIDGDVTEVIHCKPIAVIVKADKYAIALKRCQLLQKFGVYQTCWLPGQEDLANLWLSQFRD